jgi:hypothetical protein
MRGTAFVPVLLLVTLTPQPVRASVIAQTFDGAGAVAPVVVPFNFGTQPLGTISTLNFTLCFRQATSPPDSCDRGGTVSLQQQLAAPFFLAGRFRETIATGVKTPVNFPVSLGAGQRLLVISQWVTSQLGSAADSLVLRGTPAGGAPDNISLNLTGSGVPPGPCPPSSTQVLCLNNNRFKVQSSFLTGSAGLGTAGTVELTGDTGYVFFFSPSNVEAVVKVLNACSVNNRYWVFAGGLTDVRTVITVTDTQRNAVKTYINPQGTAFQPIQDTSAFATCP